MIDFDSIHNLDPLYVLFVRMYNHTMPALSNM